MTDKKDDNTKWTAQVLSKLVLNVKGSWWIIIMLLYGYGLGTLSQCSDIAFGSKQNIEIAYLPLPTIH